MTEEETSKNQQEPQPQTEKTLSEVKKELQLALAREKKLRQDIKLRENATQPSVDSSLSCPTCGKALSDHEILLSLVKKKTEPETKAEPEVEHMHEIEPLRIKEPSKPEEEHPPIPEHMQFCPSCGKKNPVFKDEVKCDHCGIHLGSVEHARKLKTCPNCGATGDVLENV